MHPRARGRSPKAVAYPFLNVIYLWKGLQGWRSIFIMVCALIIQVWIRPLQADLMSTGAQTQDIDSAGSTQPSAAGMGLPSKKPFHFLEATVIRTYGSTAPLNRPDMWLSL